jgi:hypothetical protein
MKSVSREIPRCVDWRLCVLRGENAAALEKGWRLADADRVKPTRWVEMAARFSELYVPDTGAVTLAMKEAARLPDRRRAPSASPAKLARPATAFGATLAKFPTTRH